MSEIRRNPITGDPLILSPDRGNRPGAWAATSTPDKAGCPFCPGNEEETPPELEPAGGAGWTNRVVPNKYPAVASIDGIPAHEVVIETRTHDLPFESMDVECLAATVDLWKRRFLAHASQPRCRYVSVFRNDGRTAGQSNPHPHSQLLALDHVPPRIGRELDGFSRGDCPVCAMVEENRQVSDVVIDQLNGLILLTPRASRVPYEMWIIGSPHASHWTGVNSNDLARLMISAVYRLRRIHPGAPFNFGLITAPLHTDGSNRFHWYAEIIPRLTTPAGFEMTTGEWINIETPENACTRLRNEGSP